MTRLLSVAAVALLGLVATADDKPKPADPKLKGTWVREADGLTVQFTFKSKTELVADVKAGGSGVKLTCKYDVKDDKVSAEVTDTKEEGDFPAKPPKGYKFKFTIKVDGETAKISDYEADNADEARGVVEGEYKKKKGD